MVTHAKACRNFLCSLCCSRREGSDGWLVHTFIIVYTILFYLHCSSLHWNTCPRLYKHVIQCHACVKVWIHTFAPINRCTSLNIEYNHRHRVTQASLLLPPSLHTFTCIFHISHLHIGLQSPAQLHTCIPNWTRPEVLGSFIHTISHNQSIHTQACRRRCLKGLKKRCTCYIWSNRSWSEVLSHGFQMPWPPLAFDYPLVLTLDIWHSLTPLICHGYATILYHFRPSFRTLNMLTFWLFRMTFEMTIPSWSLMIFALTSWGAPLWAA